MCVNCGLTIELPGKTGQGGALALQGSGDYKKHVAPHHCIEFTLTVQCRNLVPDGP